MTWWSTLSFGQQFLIWMFSTVITIAILVGVERRFIDGLNFISKLTEDDEARTTDDGEEVSVQSADGFVVGERDLFMYHDQPVIIIGIIFGVIGFFWMVGLPTSVAGGLFLTTLAGVGIFVAPFIRNNSLIDSIGVHRRSFNYKKGNYIETYFSGDRAGHPSHSGRLADITMSDVFLIGDDGAPIQIPLRDFLACRIINKNLRVPGINDLGLIRANATVYIQPGEDIGKAWDIMNQVIWRTHGVFDPKVKGIHRVQRSHPEYVELIGRYFVETHMDEVSTKNFIIIHTMEEFRKQDILLASRNRIDMIQPPYKQRTVQAAEAPDLRPVEHRSVREKLNLKPLKKEEPVVDPEPLEIIDVEPEEEPAEEKPGTIQAIKDRLTPAPAKDEPSEKPDGSLTG